MSLHVLQERASALLSHLPLGELTHQQLHGITYTSCTTMPPFLTAQKEDAVSQFLGLSDQVIY